MSDDKRRLMTLRTTLDGSCHDVHGYDLRACLDDRLGRVAEHHKDLLPLFKRAARGLLEGPFYGPWMCAAINTASQVLSIEGGPEMNHTIQLYWSPTDIVGESK